ncbi:hypothetical protein BUALT_Bualt17G0013300 [Buddleja alternifolia]|uniref:Uncharacterized protein n=1 Tax=Buddleja alternifolia TaxID=168488 RepID=A0AAV6WD21_9LAMI|nr:hypothetical protein BUALT_Bualt17G0013300 [Buddleja alternifolia]
MPSLYSSSGPTMVVGNFTGFGLIYDSVENAKKYELKCMFIWNGLDTNVEKSRKQMKERKNKAKKICGVKKVCFPWIMSIDNFGFYRLLDMADRCRTIEALDPQKELQNARGGKINLNVLEPGGGPLEDAIKAAVKDYEVKLSKSNGSEEAALMEKVVDA